MGLRAEILKYRGRSCANGGISDTHDQVTIVNIKGPSEPSPEAPAVMLVMGNVPGTVKVVPAEPIGDRYVPLSVPDKVGPMMGGSYVTADSRLGKAIADLLGTSYAQGIAPLHDRYETQVEYDILSN